VTTSRPKKNDRVPKSLKSMEEEGKDNDGAYTKANLKDSKILIADEQDKQPNSVTSLNSSPEMPRILPKRVILLLHPLLSIFTF